MIDFTQLGINTIHKQIDPRSYNAEEKVVTNSTSCEKSKS